MTPRSRRGGDDSGSFDDESVTDRHDSARGVPPEPTAPASLRGLARVEQRTKAPTTRGHVPAPSGSMPVPTLPPGDEPDAATIDDGMQTMLDPSPLGSSAPGFDPAARIDDNRRTQKKLRDDAPVPARAPQQTTGDQRALQARLAAIPRDPRRVEPMAPDNAALDKYDPRARIDDSSRRARIDPDSIDDNLKTAQRPAAVPPPPAAPEPMRAISMKTPHESGVEKVDRPMPAVKLRSMAEVSGATPARGMGRLAPPRDPREARSRRVRDIVIWSSVVVMLASIVTLTMWFLAGN